MACAEAKVKKADAVTRAKYSGEVYRLVAAESGRGGSNIASRSVYEREIARSSSSCSLVALGLPTLGCRGMDGSVSMATPRAASA